MPQEITIPTKMLTEQPATSVLIVKVAAANNSPIPDAIKYILDCVAASEDETKKPTPAAA